MTIHRRALLASTVWPTLAAEPTTTREAFLRLIDRPRVPPAPNVVPQAGNGNFERHHFSFASEASQRVPGLLVKPAGTAARLPVVVALHGTGGNKEGQIALLKKLANRGFLAVAIDERYHGERCRAGKGSAEYVDAILRTYRGAKERPFLYDTVWDILRLVDYLSTRLDVDAARIGMIGFSKGGMELYLAAARTRASPWLFLALAYRVSGGLSTTTPGTRAWVRFKPQWTPPRTMPASPRWTPRSCGISTTKWRRGSTGITTARGCCRSSRRARCWQSMET
ncbi:MAG: hypothetical protein FJW31_09990 [Acidobacteria bacterium]|nr:hypothetical protein [Acidobacteriota bacterium]